MNFFELYRQQAEEARAAREQSRRAMIRLFAFLSVFLCVILMSVLIVPQIIAMYQAGAVLVAPGEDPAERVGVMIAGLCVVPGIVFLFIFLPLYDYGKEK